MIHQTIVFYILQTFIITLWISFFYGQFRRPSSLSPMTGRRKSYVQYARSIETFADLLKIPVFIEIFFTHSWTWVLYLSILKLSFYIKMSSDMEREFHLNVSEFGLFSGAIWFNVSFKALHWSAESRAKIKWILPKTIPFPRLSNNHIASFLPLLLLCESLALLASHRW